MVEPSTTYEIGRMSVVVELVRLRRGESMWLVCANRRASARFINTGAVARCSNRENAQALARMLAGVEFTRDGAAIWLDGRTEAPVARRGGTPLSLVLARTEARIEGRAEGRAEASHLIERLLTWANMMGGWDAHVWAEARAFLRPEPEETER